ncbi:hypothetical protein AAMO2058_001632600 [Amorphochlora amoebiformis]
MNRYHDEQVSRYTYKIVENDPYGQYPFLYAIMGVDKCVVIDTGTGIGDFVGYLDKNINTKGLPYLVINTHAHFDHVGGNSRFKSTKGFLGVHMGGANTKFSENLDINSLCLAHNCTVKHFKVDKWLKEGDKIYLDDSDRKTINSLEIIDAPGHTPDSIAIYSHVEKILFIGDNIYPFTVIHLDCLGSNVSDYIRTLKKLQVFISKVEKTPAGTLNFKKKGNFCLPCESEGKEKEGEKKEGGEGAKKGGGGKNEEGEEKKEQEDKQNESKTTQEKKPTDPKSNEKHEENPPSQTPNPPATTTQKQTKEVHPHQKLIDNFCELTGLKEEKMAKIFSIDALMRLSNYKVNDMLDFYFSNGSALSQICPPGTKPSETKATHKSTQERKSAAKEVKEFKIPKEVKLCCGHVESSLSPSSIPDMLTLLEIVKMGGLHATHVDSGYGEFSNGTFSIMMPLKPKW